MIKKKIKIIKAATGTNRELGEGGGNARSKGKGKNMIKYVVRKRKN